MAHSITSDPTSKTIARATVKMPGTCGELVQGTLGGTSFHISCPIDVYSTVTVELTAEAVRWTFPPDTPKAAAAVEAALRHFEVDGQGGRLSVRSSLPRAKGMASSTADVAGAINAVALALGREISPAEVAQLALEIEPTDGSVFPDIVLFDHRGGELYENLGPCPRIDLIVLDFGGEIDTVSFNSHDRTDLLRSIEPRISEAVELVREGLRAGDPSLIGRGATISALANQIVLFKPQLEVVLRLAQSLGAVGVDVGHSGTVIGVLVDPRHSDAMSIAPFFRLELPDVENVQVCRLVGGGCYWEEGRQALGVDEVCTELA